MTDQEAYASIARRWRRTNPSIAERSTGYVIIFDFVVAGWKSELDEASSWMPGCIAVSYHIDNPLIYVATGGDNYSGAEKWEDLR